MSRASILPNCSVIGRADLHARMLPGGRALTFCRDLRLLRELGAGRLRRAVCASGDCSAEAVYAGAGHREDVAVPTYDGGGMVVLLGGYAEEGGGVGSEGDRSPRFGLFFFSSRRRHTRFDCDWSSDVCSSD